MRNKKKFRSLTVITVGLCLSTFLLWCVCMFCITNAVAQNYWGSLVTNNKDYAEYIGWASRLDNYFHDEASENDLVYCMAEAVAFSNGAHAYTSYEENGSISVLADHSVPSNAAVVIWDKEGNVVQKSRDIIYFSYNYKESWDTEQEGSATVGYAWINMDGCGVPQEYWDKLQDDNPFSRVWEYKALRMTGHFVGAEFIPCKLDYVTRDSVVAAINHAENDPKWQNRKGYINDTFTLSGLIHEGLLHWESLFDMALLEDDMVTIYTMNPAYYNYDEMQSVTYNGMEYENLAALLEEVKEKDYGYYAQSNQYDLKETVLFDVRYYYENEDYENAPDYTMLTAVAFYPLEGAVYSLKWVYMGTCLLAVLLVLLLRRMIKRNLTQPLAAINQEIADGWLVPLPSRSRSDWREPAELAEHYYAAHDRRQKQEDEITRLKTALSYAREAEKSRRRMTSAVAHELKTPLAIIHSYAEGLQEHIAEEKREQYLDTILTETGRMDALVLEMLDLSRLEAGRVTLTRDTFSLAELVSGAVSKLELAAKEKQLQISSGFSGSCDVYADEARLGQVVMNFVSNAVRYTPEGGSVHVKTWTRAGRTYFSIANDAKPFTEEELNLVWQTFYRTDKARSGKGTGLGLAIAKNIVELHGGQCSVCNTSDGVEFGFWIP